MLLWTKRIKAIAVTRIFYIDVINLVDEMHILYSCLCKVILLFSFYEWWLVFFVTEWKCLSVCRLYHIVPLKVCWGRNSSFKNICNPFTKFRRLAVVNLTMVSWGLFRPLRALIVPNFVIGYIFIVGRHVRVWGLKRLQKTSNVSIFWDHSKVKHECYAEYIC